MKSALTLFLASAVVGSSLGPASSSEAAAVLNQSTRVAQRLTPSPPRGSSSRFEEPERSDLQLAKGMVRVFRSPAPFNAVVVGDPEAVDVSVLTNQRLAITAKKEGFTTVLLTSEDRAVGAEVAVTVIGPPAARTTNPAVASTNPPVSTTKPVTVTTFTTRRQLRHVYHCDIARPNGCYFDKTDANIRLAPLITTGPTIGSLPTPPPPEIEQEPPGL